MCGLFSSETLEIEFDSPSTSLYRQKSLRGEQQISLQINVGILTSKDQIAITS